MASAGTALPYMTDGRQLRFMFLPDAKTLTRWYEKKVKKRLKRGWAGDATLRISV